MDPWRVPHRPGWLLAVLVWLALVGFAPAAQAREAGEAYVLTIDGVINPLTARYLERGLREASAAEAEVVVVRLNTPGGLESSTREMTQAMLGPSVPIVVFVTPPGGRAASAGMFITMAAHVAAMAPGTNIGAAHPVGLGGQADPVMSEKLENDAAALARSIANSRGRNAEWAERAVRESVSLTAEEAVEMGVADLLATGVDDLLQKIDGRQVATPAGAVTLRTAQARVVELPMSLPERILHLITDPNVAYILLTLGTIGLIAELYNPGALFPGITGAISLVLAFVAFGNLPVNWAGVILIVLALGLLVAELNTEGVGVLGAGALAAFILGSLMLYSPLTPTSPAAPTLQVSPWLIGGMVLVVVGFFVLVGRALLRARLRPVVTGAEGLVGHEGEAVSDLDPGGRVRVQGEQWTAVSEQGPIQAGEKVRVVAVDGVTLRVRRQQQRRAA